VSGHASKESVLEESGRRKVESMVAATSAMMVSQLRSSMLLIRLKACLLPTFGRLSVADI
jgi:hypothetical protein